MQWDKSKWPLNFCSSDRRLKPGVGAELEFGNGVKTECQIMKSAYYDVVCCRST